MKGLRTILIGGLLVMSSVLCVEPAHAQREKTDVIVLKNGDRVTGEITDLEYGLLRLSTDDMGTISIEWSAIASIDSQYTFDVQVAGGRRYAGVIATSDDGQDLSIRDDTSGGSVPLESVVRIEELETGFWERISGSLSVGFNYTKSTGIRTGSINISSQYQAERLKATLDISALETSSPDTEPSARENLTSTVQFERERPSFLMLLNSLERNDELGIDARLTTGGGLARYFGQDQDSEIMLLSGVVANQEWTNVEGDVLDADETQQSLEGVLGGSWRIFRFNDPEISLASTMYLYPSLTESGRWRGNLDVSLRREIISDLFFDISFYESYDSAPPSGAETTDYGIVTSLGYKF
jgi:Protein of unknown function, DUF481